MFFFCSVCLRRDASALHCDASEAACMYTRLAIAAIAVPHAPKPLGIINSCIVAGHFFVYAHRTIESVVQACLRTLS